MLPELLKGGNSRERVAALLGQKLSKKSNQWKDKDEKYLRNGDNFFFTK